MNRNFFALFVGVLSAAGLLYTVASDAKVHLATVGTDGGFAQEAASNNTDTDDADTQEASVAQAETTIPAPAGPTVAAPANYGQAGTLTDLDGWLNTEQTSLEAFAGRVRIIQFWTMGCANCSATIPTLQSLYASYHASGLEIIGVHSPEFDSQADRGAIAQATVDLGISWPVALDTRKTNFQAWQGERRFWPRTYVLDANGDIRYDHIGEGNYAQLESTVAYLLANGGS